MGAPTIRYLHHLLEIDYFKKLNFPPVLVRSTIFGSITSLSGANNGSYIVSNCGAYFNQENWSWEMEEGSKMEKAFKMTIFFQNFFKSQNRQLEVIKEIHTTDSGD